MAHQFALLLWDGHYRQKQTIFVSPSSRRCNRHKILEMRNFPKWLMINNMARARETAWEERLLYCYRWTSSLTSWEHWLSSTNTPTTAVASYVAIVRNNGNTKNCFKYLPVSFPCVHRFPVNVLCTVRESIVWLSLPNSMSLLLFANDDNNNPKN